MIVVGRMFTRARRYVEMYSMVYVCMYVQDAIVCTYSLT